MGKWDACHQRPRRREGNARLGTLTGQRTGLAGGLDVECEEKGRTPGFTNWVNGAATIDMRSLAEEQGLGVKHGNQECYYPGKLLWPNNSNVSSGLDHHFHLLMEPLNPKRFRANSTSVLNPFLTLAK